MWNVALESWQWIHQVAAPCSVICGSGMTCHWIRPVAAPCNVTRSSGIMTFNSAGGSTLQCGRWLWNDKPLNSPKRPPYWNSTSGLDFDHIITVDMSFCTMQSAKFYPNRTTLGRKKWRHVDFQDSGSQPSWILRNKDPIMGSLKSPASTSYRSSIDIIALNCLVFREIAFFCI